MALKSDGWGGAVTSVLRHRPGARGALEALGFSVGFGLLFGQGWLLEKLLVQNGRLLLRLERLEAMLAQASTAPHASADVSAALDRVHVGPRATYSRVSVAERSTWDAALEEYGGTAMQSWHWGQFLQQLGYTVVRVRVDGLLGTGLAQVVFENLGHGTTAHISRGPVIAGDWLSVARELFDAVDELAVRHDAVTVTVEPDAPLPPDAAYEAVGFVAADQQYYNPARTVKVPLLDDHALLDQMRSRTRYKVRLGQRRGVRVTEHTSADVAAMTAFHDLLQNTARRNEFEIEERSYYEDFMSVFGEDAALLLAHLGETPVAGLIVVRAAREGIYMFGASSTEHRVPGATAYLQFEAMRWARDHGCTRYDLWGISAEDPTPTPGQWQRSQGGEWQGLHHFKVGFGGEIVAYPPAWERPIQQAANGTSITVDERVALTIGMATYNDFDGVYFTIQALRLYQDLRDTELLVIDNYGCERTKEFVEGWAKGRYVLATEAVGTAAPRDLVFREARGEAVLCCDSHILFAPGAIARLKAYYREHPGCVDLLQGPLVYDDLQFIATHFEPTWRDQMWGTWETDPRGEDPEGEPFEIPMQGLGVFSCRKCAWPGFNPRFRGFGGEEGYIHEKVRQAGGRCLCLPWFRWVHRFGRPGGEPYPLTVDDKFRNYLIGHAELGLDLQPVFEHFSEHLPEDSVRAIAEEVLGQSRALR
jgi:lipid II:glycine glycyltransferase (peptidoglycan interpeptide bridge formation enzyme)